MKDFRTMKRQRGRSRKSGGNGNTHNPNRAYESNGPEGVKVRGNAQTIYEKYQQLARDANAVGDRVLAEGFLQHAEHYFRLIRLMQPQRPVAEFVQRDPFAQGFEDFEEEYFPESADSLDNSTDDGQEMSGDNRGPERNNERNFERDNRQDRHNNNNRNRDRDRDQNREYQPRENREPKDRDIAARDANDGQDRDRNDNSRRETRRERYERRRQQQQRTLDGIDAPANSFQPQTEPVAPAFIASTQPLAPSRPVEAPVLTDAAALPDFIRRPAPVEPVEKAVTAVAEVAEKPARKPRAKKAVASIKSDA
jgi:hypothetical protein